MPTPPEVDNAGCFIGRIEVPWQLDSKCHRNAQSHICVATEIEVELKSVRKESAPRFKKRYIGTLVSR
ncbi:hypothetical protein GCM10008940_18530 [Microbulbifer agarilyticus]